MNTRLFVLKATIKGLMAKIINHPIAKYIITLIIFNLFIKKTLNIIPNKAIDQIVIKIVQPNLPLKATIEIGV